MTALASMFLLGWLTGRRMRGREPWFADSDTARFVAVLCDHALVEIRCDHEAKTDTPICNCAVVALGSHPSVQKAKEAWALHVLHVLRTPDETPTQSVLAHIAKRGTA